MTATFTATGFDIFLFSLYAGLGLSLGFRAGRFIAAVLDRIATNLANITSGENS